MAGTDDRHPADVVTGMVGHVLVLAATSPRRDGRPVEVYTVIAVSPVFAYAVNNSVTPIPASASIKSTPRAMTVADSHVCFARVAE
jgi:hypothetical protein